MSIVVADRYGLTQYHRAFLPSRSLVVSLILHEHLGRRRSVSDGSDRWVTPALYKTSYSESCRHSNDRWTGSSQSYKTFQQSILFNPNSFKIFFHFNLIIINPPHGLIFVSDLIINRLFGSYHDIANFSNPVDWSQSHHQIYQFWH
jgi:hypothetical protein